MSFCVKETALYSRSNATLPGLDVATDLPEETMLTAYLLPELILELHFCNHIYAPTGTYQWEIQMPYFSTRRRPTAVCQGGGS